MPLMSCCWTRRRCPFVVAAMVLAWVVSASQVAAGAPAQTICSSPLPLVSGVCEVVGSGAETLVVGTVLAPEHVYRGGGVRFDAQGVITCVGCGCDGGGRHRLRCCQDQM